MFCSNCGKEINKEAVICVHCGVMINSNYNKKSSFPKSSDISKKSPSIIWVNFAENLFGLLSILFIGLSIIGAYIYSVATLNSYGYNFTQYDISVRSYLYYTLETSIIALISSCIGLLLGIASLIITPIEKKKYDLSYNIVISSIQSFVFVAVMFLISIFLLFNT